MFARLGNLVSRHWVLVVLVWAVILVSVRAFAPNWDDVTYDGDLAYMPASMSSVKGERLLDEAFPRGRAKSQVVIIISRDDGPLEAEDLQVSDRIAAQLNNLHGVSTFQRSQSLWIAAANYRDQGDDQRAEEG